MVKPRFPGHVEAPSATRRATDKWAHDTMRPEQLDSGSTHTSQPQEGCALLHPLQGVSLLSTPLQGGILKPPALRVVVDFWSSASLPVRRAWAMGGRKACVQVSVMTDQSGLRGRLFCLELCRFC